MTTKPYLHYVGHLVSMTQSLHYNEDSRHNLNSLWSTYSLEETFDEKITYFLHDAVHVMHQAEENDFENRIGEHEIHVAAGEVEMWIQSVEILLEEYYEETQLHNIVGGWIHGPTHTLTTIAQGVRLIELVRTSPNLIAQLGGRERSRDIINRGWTLLSRLYQAMKPITSFPLCLESYKDIANFFNRLDSIAQEASKEDLTRLVYAGYVPSGHGLPVGGSGFNIELHKNAQSAPPDQSSKKPTSGWSIGRYGNKENIGEGRQQPTF